ncbi:DUF4917 family protein [Aeromonas veronii]|uniref:DUF4917 family protein n=1 Tax=Aeromonas veronii TaxID=654 RepID=UPI00191DDB1A|nr:DUF4917 family protein [Aeromonas veronii]MBL0592638.1 DUF4917 family protein [Aeromonas veronii]
MPHRIFEWEEISQIYNRGALLLGNGASISINARFGYSSLIEHAQENNLLTDDVQQLFNFFNTSDFELILRLVWQASNVNRSLLIPDARTHEAYIRVRECLIQAVRDVHPEYQDVSEHIPAIYNFLRSFRTVISLNYDLILYWTIMYGLGVPDHHSLKDCFVNGHFYEDWRRLRTPIYGDRTTTLAFYPHGSLVLARDNIESELKITGNGNGLLGAILQAWQSEMVVPLFVSEGTSAQKIKSIRNSHYLNTVYREVLTTLEPALVIYGWGLWEQDVYILQRIASSQIRHVAVSVYGNDQAYCNRVSHTIHQVLGNGVQIHFFRSNSPGVWNNAT